jgi:hypothetical protein
MKLSGYGAVLLFVLWLLGCKSAPIVTTENLATVQPPVVEAPSQFTLYINEQKVPFNGLSTLFPAQHLAKISFTPGLQIKLFQRVAGKLSAVSLGEEQKKDGMSFFLRDFVQDSDWFFITSKESQLLVDDQALAGLVDKLPPVQIPKSQLVRPLMWRIYNIERTAATWELPGLAAHLKTTVEICHVPFSLQLLANKPGQLSQYEFVPGIGQLSEQHRLQFRLNTHYTTYCAVWLVVPQANGQSITQFFPGDSDIVIRQAWHLQDGQTVLLPEQPFAASGQGEFYLLAARDEQAIREFNRWLGQQTGQQIVTTPTVSFAPGVAWYTAPYPHIRLQLEPGK